MACSGTCGAFVFSALALFWLGPLCLACVYMVSPSQVIRVGPTFRVEVDNHRGRPVQGLSLQLESDTPEGRAVTDGDGFASFRGLAPGLYSLNALQDDVSWAGRVLQVGSNGPADITVTMAWPAAAPVAVRSLKGTLRGPESAPGQPGPELKLTLLSGVSGQELASARTSPHGDFDLRITPPGIYFLNIGPFTQHPDGNPIGGRIAVSVEPDAPADHFELELVPTDCGLSYIDLTPCPPAELHIGELRGRVTGPVGHSIPDAEILLVDPSGKLVERLSSDRSGEFSSKQDLVGSYDLLVRRFGFQTYRGRVFVAPELPPSAALDIQLGICGVAPPRGFNRTRSLPCALRVHQPARYPGTYPYAAGSRRSLGPPDRFAYDGTDFRHGGRI